jgi:valyl-tRNA synthetase
MLDKHYDAQRTEPEIYAAWERSGAFRPGDAQDVFSVVIPPPNVTGSLHLGHALNCTLQDVLARFERMRGKAVLWQPGTDHAGIATQMVVERQLKAAGNADRRALGREAFLERVWAWKAESGGQISNQLRRLGASCDWSRERFTLDEGLSAAVRRVFVQLYREGLIHRAEGLVNWDPHFETAISNLEVENEPVKGSMWLIAYPLVDGDGEIVVGTTRPETLLGDAAIAVHPEDPRYRDLIGRQVQLPLTGRTIPVIADTYSDPEKGTGAVKITPAHDFNDFKVGRRHGLPMLNILTARAAIADTAPEAYRGLDRFEARKRILADLEAQGLLRGEERQDMTQPTGDRSGVVIEPWLTEQWYVDTAPLAARALAAVDAGETRFFPDNWTHTYRQWLTQIEPWCISRQLWWGHRIPAWYGPDGKVFVAETEAEAREAARAHYGEHTPLRQDEDVLDTWFSSALWPFSTKGWPEDTQDLRRFYPTTTLVTMFDIIFFWVARMMMMGTHLTGKAPFANVIIHSRVVDRNGKKMSKSKGNVIDPLDLIDRFGADALRFSLAIAAGPGRDIRMSEERVAGYRNFTTKLWNAARFCQMNECALWEAFDPASLTVPVNRWIVGETARVSAETTRALEAYRFDEAARALYDFVWGVFCDWYLELIKPLLNGDNEVAKAETRSTAAWALDRILQMLHPFMPFVTEELWDKLTEFGPERATMLVSSHWPSLPDTLVREDAAAELGWVIDLVSEVRSTRAELNVPAAARIPLLMIDATPQQYRWLEAYEAEIDRLARLSYSVAQSEAPAGSVTFVVGGATVALPIADVIDVEAERARLARDIDRMGEEATRLAAKLDNHDFVRKAPEEVVEDNRARLADLRATVGKLSQARDRLGTLA